MLSFVTTVRHPANARSYAKIGELLANTLTSICRQTSADFTVVVVHNDPAPPCPAQDARVHFVPVDFPPPGIGQADALGYAELIRDKGTKTAIGIAVARDLGASHVMFADADDLINRDIADIVAATPTAPGWFSPSGYIYTSGLRTIQPIADGFHLKNGSTNVIRIDLTGVPSTVTKSSSQQQILDLAGQRHVDQILGQHEKWRPAVEAQGEALSPLPVPSAVWVIGTGENHSGNLSSARNRDPIDQRITGAFGLEPPTRWGHALTTISVLWHRVRRRVGARSRA